MNKYSSLVAVVLFAMAAAPAMAGTPIPLPEPGVLELLSIAGIAALVAGIIRRKK